MKAVFNCSMYSGYGFGKRGPWSPDLSKRCFINGVEGNFHDFQSGFLQEPGGGCIEEGCIGIDAGLYAQTTASPGDPCNCMKVQKWFASGHADLRDPVGRTFLIVNPSHYFLSKKTSIEIFAVVRTIIVYAMKTVQVASVCDFNLNRDVFLQRFTILNKYLLLSLKLSGSS